MQNKSLAESQQKSAIPEIVYGVALLILAWQLLWALWNYADVALAAIQFPFPLDYGEGPILDQTLRLLQGENIYRPDLTQVPYVVSNYPPLFHLLQLPFAQAFGPAFWYGRALSVMSAVIAAILIGLIIQSLTKDWVASLIAGVLLFSFPYIAGWSFFNRVDTLALAFSLAGLHAVVRWPSRVEGLVLAFVCFIAAIGSKHSYALAGPLTACVWLWLRGQRNFAIALAAALAVTSAGIFALFNIATEGGFYLNLVTANANPFVLSTVTDYFINLIVRAGYLVIGIVLFICVERIGDRLTATPFVIIYLIASAMAAISVGKVGSSINYIYELAAALCMGAGVALAWANQSYFLRAFVAIVIAIQAGSLSTWADESYLTYVRSKIQVRSDITKLADIVQAAQGQVLADEWMGLLPQQGYPLSYQPFEYYMLNIAGLWQPGDLQARITRHEFAAILLYNPSHFNSIQARWPKSVRDTIYANYKLQERLAETLVYVPK